MLWPAIEKISCGRKKNGEYTKLGSCMGIGGLNAEQGSRDFYEWADHSIDILCITADDALYVQYKVRGLVPEWYVVLEWHVIPEWFVVPEWFVAPE